MELGGTVGLEYSSYHGLSLLYQKIATKLRTCDSILTELLSSCSGDSSTMSDDIWESWSLSCADSRGGRSLS